MSMNGDTAIDVRGPPSHKHTFYCGLRIFFFVFLVFHCQVRREPCLSSGSGAERNLRLLSGSAWLLSVYRVLHKYVVNK